MNIQKPKIIKNIFNEKDFNDLKTHLYNKPKLQSDFDPSFERYCFNDKLINEYLQKLVPVAREIFNSNTLVGSYGLFAHYEGNNPNLFTHKDNNACTYTLDMCVYQTEPWDLNVDGEPYTLQENEALAYYGNDQMHGRGAFPKPNSQHVAMIFFHFVEPDHWWNTKGQDYVRVIRGEITEDQWKLEHGRN
jgi:hypothetical protein